jgi:rhodanese-related sulfurtransferase
MDRIPVGELLSEARSHLERLEPRAAYDAVRRGALLVDVRDSRVRERDGAVPDAIHITLDVLEWRMDPASGHQDPRVGDLDRQVIVLCRQGYSSSLAARRLQTIGFWRATDVVGGFEAWAATGLPVEVPS